MTASAANQLPAWRGPTLLSYGFRPLFLLAALWATGSMVVWIAMLSGALQIPTHFDPVTWHAHEFLFGYLSAVIAGFLLTAVPNWTGRSPVQGWQLAGLVVLWIIGRVAIFASASLPVWSIVLADLAFLTVLWAVIAREIIASKKWANLPVLILIGVFVLSNLLFHVEDATGGYAALGYGLRLAVSVVLTLVVLIGGKIIPSFTRNYLDKQGVVRLPTLPMQRFDKAVIAATIIALIGWTLAPDARPTGVGLIVIAGLHLMRLARWSGAATLAEPLIWVLHLAYIFVPLGALLNGAAIWSPDVITPVAALHVWTAGTLGLMTVAVMTRATLGHTGHALHAGGATTLIYLSLVLSVTSRVLADVWPLFSDQLLNLSALFWVACFGGFVVAYGPMLLRSKKSPTE